MRLATDQRRGTQIIQSRIAQKTRMGLATDLPAGRQVNADEHG